MFKRKDEDIDLLGDAVNEAIENAGQKSEPKMTTDTPATPANSAATPTAPDAPTTAVTPATATTTSTAGGYTRPTDSGARPATSFRPAAPTPVGRAGSDYRPAAGSSFAGAGDAPSDPPAKSNAGRRVLTVGNEILLKGEIATCDRLVIEGAVDATLNEVHTVEISETGSFKGAAEIEDAEISGLFDGELVVRGRLVIYSTGQVRGKVTYGEIEIERGGELTGSIKTYDAADAKKSSKSSTSKKEKMAA